MSNRTKRLGVLLLFGVLTIGAVMVYECTNEDIARYRAWGVWGHVKLHVDDLPKFASLSSKLTNTVSLEIEVTEIKPYDVKEALKTIGQNISIKYLTILYPLGKKERTLVDDLGPEWTSLENLNIKNVAMKTIPAIVYQLPKLKELNLETCSLKVFPTFQQRLPNLTHLSLVNNDIEVLPLSEDLDSLPALSYLSLRANDIYDLTPIAAYERLEELHLENNKLGSKATTGTVLDSTQQSGLRILYIDRNRLSALPAVLAQCTALKELSAADNRLQGNLEMLTHLKQLEVLLLSGNYLAKSAVNQADFPKLEVLEIKSQIITIPEGKPVEITR